MAVLSSPSYLNIGHWNIEGFKSGNESKFNNLEFQAEIRSHDIIGLTETHAGPDDILAIEGYTAYSNSRKKHKKARKFSGGITILIKNEIVDGVEIIKSSPDVIWVHIKGTFFNSKCDIFAGFVYISPQNSITTKEISEKAWEQLEFDTTRFINKGKVMVMGDFNARSGKKDDFIGLDDNEYTPEDSQYTSDVSRHRNSMDECVNEYGKKLCEFCKNVGLRIMNGRCMGDLKGSFTCYQWNGCSTVDYCIAQEDLLQDLQMFKVHEFKGNLSNHCKISTQLSISAKIKNSRIDTHPLTKVKWTEEMKMKYKIAIQTTQFLEAVESLSTNVEEDINTLINELSNLLVGILPRNNKSTEKKKRKSKRQKWYDQDCRDMKSSLYKLNRSLIKNPYDKEIREKFFHIRKSYKKLLRYKMKQYKNEIIEKIDTLKSSNAGEFWKLVRELKELDTEKKTKINSDIIPPEKWFTHFENLLGSQVKSKDSMENIEYEIEKLKNEPYFNELDFSIKESEIKKAISNLKKGKACGLDNINNEMIKISQDVCLVTYQKIFNKILNTGIFPSKWSKGYITPIHKAGNASDPNNYRGIIINSCLSKVFTSIINDRLYK
ncbi:hypothetical protein FSP39_016377 [Pinctada imbricata]|uniref:Endonuclease/exonuclease/phosphatase domain-containing protein n=1 Tax=Pinctada imbricata TaxID=66713 RepID=A0AA88YJX5_PINIB|nr:hypothetical protein FSP39_016377 [Pinctada imbricata]